MKALNEIQLEGILVPNKLEGLNIISITGCHKAFQTEIPHFSLLPKSLTNLTFLALTSSSQWWGWQ